MMGKQTYSVFSVLISMLMLLTVSRAMGNTFPDRMPNGKYVNDYATIFSNQEVHNLEEKCKTFRDETGNELIFLTVNSVDKIDMDAYCDSVVKNWKNKQLDIYGYWIMVVIAPDARQYKIITGNAVQPQLTEEIVAKIQANYLRPQIKDKKYYAGALTTSELLTGVLNGEVAESDLNSGYQGTIIAILLAFLVIFIILIPVTQFQSVRESAYGSRRVGLLSGFMIRYGQTFIGRKSYDDFAHAVGQFKAQPPLGSGGGSAHGKW